MVDNILINITNTHIFECQTDTIARSGEANTPIMQITFPERFIEKWSYLDFKKPNGETFRSPCLETEGNVATFPMPLYLLDTDGVLEVQFVTQDESGLVWKTYTKKFNVKYSINAVDDIPEKNDFVADVQKTIDDMQKTLDYIEENTLDGESAYDIAQKHGFEGTEQEWVESLNGEDGVDGQTPYIGENGNWWIGDTDTGTKAKGEKGDSCEHIEEYLTYNKFIQSEVTTGYYFNSNKEVAKNSAYNISGHIPCRAGKCVYFSSAVKPSQVFIRGIEFLDKNKERISCSALNDATQGGLIKAISTKSAKELAVRYVIQITDEDCYYIRIAFPKDLQQTLVIEVRDFYSDDPLDVDYVVGQKIDVPLEKEIPYWRGKTIIWNGDSIPAGYNSRAGYPELVGLHLGCNIINHSIGGSALAVNTEIPEYKDDDSYNVAYRHPLVERYGNEMDGSGDLVCIAIGTNDWCYSHTPFGSMNPTTEEDKEADKAGGTFYGALKILCEGLLNKYVCYYDAEVYDENGDVVYDKNGNKITNRRLRDTPIVFFTPIKRVVYHYDQWDENKTPIHDSGGIKMAYYDTNAYGKTLGDYANAIKEVCGYYGIPVLDLYNECLINPLIDSIKTSYFPMNNSVYIKVEQKTENGEEKTVYTEVTQDQYNAYTGEKLITTSRDGTHPNIHGHKILARRITGYIKQLADGVF